jgi:hypothetical protein
MTRKEDEAYCLLGLFDVNMPLIYGEGARAFQRLQEEIIRTSTDQSIFAWELLSGCREESDHTIHPGLFTPSPANFCSNVAGMIFHHEAEGKGFQVTSECLEIDLRLDAYHLKYGYNTVIAWLNYGTIGAGFLGYKVGIWLELLEPVVGTAVHGQVLKAVTTTHTAISHEGGLKIRRRLTAMPNVEE